MLPRTETTQPYHLFDTVYQLAKDHHKLDLQYIVEHGFNLSPFDGNVTPIMKLAAEGNDQAVNLLMNEFSVSPSEAARGYAEACNAEKVNQLLNKGASIQEVVFGYMLGNHIKEGYALLDKGASLRRAVHACAIRGDQDQVNALTAQDGAEKSQYAGYARGGHDDCLGNNHSITNMVEIIYGYAMRKDIAKVEKWLTELKKSSNDDYVQGLNEAMRGFAIQGLVGELMTDLWEKGGSIDNAVSGYAEGGYVKEVNYCLDKAKLLGDAVYQQCLDVAVNRYAVKNNVKGVNDLLEKGASLNKAIEGYAWDGNEKQVEELLAKNPDKTYINSAATGYAIGEYFNLIEKMLLRGADAQCALPSSFNSHHKKYMLRTLAFLSDADCRKRLFDAVRERHLSIWPISELPFMIKFVNERYDELKPLLDQAQVLHDLMQQTGCGYRDAVLRYDAQYGVQEEKEVNQGNTIEAVPTVVANDTKVTDAAITVAPDNANTATNEPSALVANGMFTALAVVNRDSPCSETEKNNDQQIAVIKR